MSRMDLMLVFFLLTVSFNIAPNDAVPTTEAPVKGSSRGTAEGRVRRSTIATDSLPTDVSKLILSCLHSHDETRWRKIDKCLAKVGSEDRKTVDDFLSKLEAVQTAVSGPSAVSPSSAEVLAALRRVGHFDGFVNDVVIKRVSPEIRSAFGDAFDALRSLLTKENLHRLMRCLAQEAGLASGKGGDRDLDAICANGRIQEEFGCLGFLVCALQQEKVFGGNQGRPDDNKLTLALRSLGNEVAQECEKKNESPGLVAMVLASMHLPDEHKKCTNYKINDNKIKEAVSKAEECMKRLPAQKFETLSWPKKVMGDKYGNMKHVEIIVAFAEHFQEVSFCWDEAMGFFSPEGDQKRTENAFLQYLKGDLATWDKEIADRTSDVCTGCMASTSHFIWNVTKIDDASSGDIGDLFKMALEQKVCFLKGVLKFCSVQSPIMEYLRDPLTHIGATRDIFVEFMETQLKDNDKLSDRIFKDAMAMIYAYLDTVITTVRGKLDGNGQ